MWDGGRFLQTANFFNGPEALLKRLGPEAVLKQLTQGNAAEKETVLWSPERTDRLEWGPLDDVVMGGVSESSFEVQRGDAPVGVFSGICRTENNGGFCGCRTRAISPALRLGACRGVRLRVRGDGNRYKLIVRDDYNWNGIAWTYCFDTQASEEWLDVDAPFEAFVPTLFARTVPGVRLKTDSITVLQLTLSKFELDGGLNPSFTPGRFKLEMKRAEVF